VHCEVSDLMKYWAKISDTYDEALDVFVAPVIPEVLEVVSETD